MKPATLLAVSSLILVINACKKDQILKSLHSNQGSYIDSSMAFLRAKLSAGDFDKLNLSSCRVLRYRKEDWAVQIFEKENVGNIFLLLQRQGQSIKGNWVDMSKLVKVSPRYASGIVTLMNFDKTLGTSLIVDSNRVIKKETETNRNSNLVIDYSKKSHPAVVNSDSLSPDVASPVLPEIVIYYDVNGGSTGIDYVSWYWLLDEISSDSYVYIQSNEGGGANSVGNIENVANAPLILSPDEPISDLKAELKCFTANSTSICSISVNINQPDPGTRDLVNPLSSFPVGHTFLTLEQDNPDGSSIIRSVGFYPRDYVNPGTLTDHSIFGDDSNTPYNISLLSLIHI